jgi:tetratricopeptide (TPR) repeat protein
MNLQAAYELHQAGRYADAACTYQALLDRDPDDADVLHLFGVMHHQCGYSARAAELTGRAVALRPHVAAYRANLAEIQRALGQHEQAAESCRTALRLKPDYPEALNNLGLALHDLGRHEEAIAQFDAALAVRPDFAMAQNNRGTALRALGKTVEAQEAYQAALALDEKLARAHANLGQMLADEGKLAEGLVHCRDAVHHGPELPEAHNNLGNVLRGLERWADAADAYGEAVRLQPGLAVAHANLGLVLRQLGRPAVALTHLRRAAELDPDDDATWLQLAYAHGQAEDWAAAIEVCERRAAKKPDDANAHTELGWAYQSDNRHAEAEASFRHALELEPDHLDARVNLGELHEELGAMKEAEACYREAEVRHPRSPLPLARRAVLVRGKLPEADRDRLRYAMYGPTAPNVRLNLLFALAHVADARGEYAEAAACLEPANAMARELRQSRHQPYDPDQHTRFVDRLIATFTPERMRRLHGLGDDSVRPVFVFGMPRSGTTLTEQVLASHSQVFGAGELPLAHQLLDELAERSRIRQECGDSSKPAERSRIRQECGDSSKPAERSRIRQECGDSSKPAFAANVATAEDVSACLDVLDGALLRELARKYQDGVQKILDRQPAGRQPHRVVDKMPDNYLCLGLIALLFPRATLIYVKRDVRDVAVSCWMTHFRSIRWADDTDSLARRIAEHRRLMTNWQAVLPVPMHEVCYEQLVDDFEPEARRLVAACGLDWEPACLEFHQTARPVRTASVTQVRQPLYRKALARWKHYEPYLAGLFNRLMDEQEPRAQ